MPTWTYCWKWSNCSIMDNAQLRSAVPITKFCWTTLSTTTLRTFNAILPWGNRSGSPQVCPVSSPWRTCSKAKGTILSKRLVRSCTVGRQHSSWQIDKHSGFLKSSYSAMHPSNRLRSLFPHVQFSMSILLRIHSNLAGLEALAAWPQLVSHGPASSVNLFRNIVLRPMLICCVSPWFPHFEPFIEHAPCSEFTKFMRVCPNTMVVPILHHAPSTSR